MPLSQTQIDYITKRTNERGAAYTQKPYHFLSTQILSSGSQSPDWGLNIVIQANDGSDGQGGRGKGEKNWLTDDAAFRNTVEDALTGCERHFG